MYKKVTLTDEEKYMQSQLILERELTGLKGQFACIQLGRSYESGLYRKTSKVVPFFVKEHQNLLDDLQIATNSQRKKEDGKIYETLNRLLADSAESNENVSKYKVFLKELEVEIKLVKKSVEALQKQQITDRQYEDRVWQAIKIVEALENKLEVQMIKFGVICTKNKELRMEIDHLLCERNVFIVQWDKFILKLCKGKKIMLDLIEQATIAFNQREEWCNKLQALRTKAHQDLVVNMQEMREYKRKHDNGLKLEEFFLVKGQKRILRDLRAQARQKARKRRKEAQNKYDTYTAILEDIQNFTRETEIEIIAQKFVTQEERNLSCFKYIIDTIGDMEMVNDDLIANHLDIEELTILHERRNLQQRSRLEHLENHLEDTEAEANDAQKQLEETSAKFNNLLEGVSTLFKICKCDKDPILQLLGDHTIVRDYNVFLFLEVLEDQVQRLLITAGYRDKLMSEKKKLPNAARLLSMDEHGFSQIYPIDKIIKSTPCSLCMEHEMVADVIDVLQTVYDREQIKRKLKFRLKLPGALETIHNISHCHLPKSRGLMQKRYE